MMQNKPTLSDALNNSKTLAVVGLSDDNLRPSYMVAKYMQDHGCPMEISFDHDLGGDDTAMRVVKQMVEEDLESGGKFIPVNF